MSEAGVARAVAAAGALGMIGIATLTVLDALLRWLLSASVPGLNEVTAMLFAVAVAACMPYALACGTHLSVDLLGGRIGPRLAAVLELAGTLLTLAFFALVGWQLAMFAAELAGQNRQTLILGWHQAPFMYAAAALFALAALVQLAVVARAARALPDATAIAGAVVISALLACLGASATLPGVQDFARAEPGAAAALAFLLLWGLLLARLPMGPLMGLLGLAGTVLYLGTAPALSTLGSNVAGFLTNSEVAALPLFLLMGSIGAAAGVAEDIYRLAHATLSSFRGGLALATIGGCAGFGAVTGSSIATVATIGKVALPEMRSRGYSHPLALGCVCAGGTLGQLVPPSTAIIVYALLTEQSIGKLFVAVVVPAALTVLSYFLVVAVYVRLRPDSAPPAERASVRELREALIRAIGVIVLFALVLGGLYAGVFTATESASVGVVGTVIYAAVRGRLNLRSLRVLLSDATATLGMIYLLILGAFAFSFFAASSGLPDRATSWAATLDITPLGLVATLLAIYLLLGCVMDSFGLMIVTTPIVAPLLAHLGYDLVWWGIVMVVVVETGMITPPFGLNIFMLKGITERPLLEVYRGTLPFVAADLVKLALLVLVPATVLWLPSTMFR